MNRYINASKLEKDGWSMVRIRQASPTEMVYETKKPTDFPVADVQEVRHGRWIKKYRGNYLCSVCGAWYRTTDDYGNIIDSEMTANYCEFCGAKMDEVEEMSKVAEMEMAYAEYLND